MSESNLYIAYYSVKKTIAILKYTRMICIEIICIQNNIAPPVFLFVPPFEPEQIQYTYNFTFTNKTTKSF